PGKGKPGPSNALDLPVIAYLKRERSRPCPFCQRWMDYHVLIDHMQYCCVQEVGEDAIGSSSAKDPLSFESPPKTAQKDGVRQCILCKRWMDSNYLVNHMRDFHVVEVKEAVEKAKAEKRKRAAQPAIETYATFMKKKRRFVEPEEGDIDMRCPICELNYPSQEDLVTHCRIYHGERYALVHRRTFKSAADYKVSVKLSLWW
ncbi:zinc finger, C2H2 type, partial [Cooperia oncophora]